jgi:hypothetical protein
MELDHPKIFLQKYENYPNAAKRFYQEKLTATC